MEAITVDWPEREPPADHFAGHTADHAADHAESPASVARRLVNPPTSAPWYVDGGTGVFVDVPPTVPTRGLVFLANRRIPAGGEVYFNYRLNPNGGQDTPEWYAHVPEELVWKVVDEAAWGAAEKKKEEEEGQRREKTRRPGTSRSGDWGSGALQ